MSFTTRDFATQLQAAIVKKGDREKHGMRTRTNSQGKHPYPINSKAQAISALKLRHHAKPPLTKQELENLYRRAAKYAPEAVKRAREADKHLL